MDQEDLTDPTIHLRCADSDESEPVNPQPHAEEEDQVETEEEDEAAEQLPIPPPTPPRTPRSTVPDRATVDTPEPRRLDFGSDTTSVASGPIEDAAPQEEVRMANGEAPLAADHLPDPPAMLEPDPQGPGVRDPDGPAFNTRASHRGVHELNEGDLEEVTSSSQRVGNEDVIVARTAYKTGCPSKKVRFKETATMLGEPEPTWRHWYAKLAKVLK